MSRNLAASIRARLKQHADESQAGLQPDTHALRSGAAAVSPVHLSVLAHNFLLKGALHGEIADAIVAAAAGLPLN